MCVTWLLHMYSLTHWRMYGRCVWHDSLSVAWPLCVTWLLHMYNMTHFRLHGTCAWHDSFSCATWLIFGCMAVAIATCKKGPGPSHLQNDFFSIIWQLCVTWAHFWHASFVTNAYGQHLLIRDLSHSWHLHMCNMTSAHSWHASFVTHLHA